MTGQDLETERIKAALVHEEELFKATSTFEHAALKPLPLLNGGAIIAALTFAGHTAATEPRPIDGAALKQAIIAWAIGLICAVLAMFFAYYSQFSFRKDHSRKLEADNLRREGRVTEASKQQELHDQYIRVGFFARYGVYACAIASLVGFAFGAMFGANSLQLSASQAWLGGGSALMWTIIDILATLFVAALGLYMTLISQSQAGARKKAALFVAVMIATGLSITAKFVENDRLESKLTGGDNYCFISLAKSPDGSLFAQLANDTGRIPSVAYGIYRSAGENQWQQHGPWFGHAPCLKTTVNLPLPMPIGRYRIDFMGSNFDWHQHLILEQKDNQLLQTTWVESKDGKVLRPRSTAQIGG